MQPRLLLLALAAPLLLSQLGACASPGDTGQPVAQAERRTAPPRQCPTGTNICRRDTSDPMATVSGEDWKNEPGKTVGTPGGGAGTAVHR